MSPFGLLHHHPGHRARQLRWVVPFVAALLLLTFAVLAIQYRVSGQEVQGEFFRAHKTIHNTSQLLQRGTMIGGVVLLMGALVTGVWALRFSYRIVRPLHTLHRALDALREGDLGVRVQFHRHDEFHEIGDGLNALVARYGATLADVHRLSDEIVALSDRAAADPAALQARAQLHERILELDRRLDAFRLAPERIIREDA